VNAGVVATGVLALVAALRDWVRSEAVDDLRDGGSTNRTEDMLEECGRPLGGFRGGSLSVV
jgi:hypothetical protein